MRITLPTEALVRVVGHAAGVAASKSPKPILECIGMRAGPAGLVLEATDLDVAIRLVVPDVSLEEEGDVYVPASRLQAVVREVGEEQVTLTATEGDLEVRTGRSRFRIRAEGGEGAAEIPVFPEAGGLSLPRGPLRDMIRRTVFATAHEAGRYALHGVLFRAHGTALELVATDGRRLARAVRTLDDPVERDLRVIVGPKGLSHLDRVLEAGDGPVSVALQERQVLFEVGDALVVSRLIDGTFPTYEDVIPPRSERGFEIEAGPFAAALRQASLLTTRDSPVVQFTLDPELLTIRSRAVQVGEACVEIPVPYTGDPLQVGFSPMFLTEVLRVIDPEAKVRFEIRDAKSPGRLSDREDYVYVIMPIALE